MSGGAYRSHFKPRKTERRSPSYRRNNGIFEMYRFFKQKHPKKTSPYFVEERLYKQVCYFVNKLMVRYMIEESGELTMWGNMGRHYIGKRSPSKRPYVDQYETQKLKEAGEIITVRYTNFHTNGHFFRFMWNRRTAHLTGKEAYSFTPTRGNKRALAKWIKENPDTDYFL